MSNLSPSVIPCGHITLTRLPFHDVYYHATISLDSGKTRSIFIPQSLYMDIEDLDISVDHYMVRIQRDCKPSGIMTLIRRLTMLGELIRSKSEVSGFTWYYDFLMDHSIGSQLKPLQGFSTNDYFKGLHVINGGELEYLFATGKHRISIKRLSSDSNRVCVTQQEIVEGHEMPSVKQVEYQVALTDIYLDGWFIGFEGLYGSTTDELILHSGSVGKYMDHVLKIK